MSLRHCLIFWTLALAAMMVALLVWGSVPLASILFLYTAVSFFLLGVAYAGAGPRLLGKCRDGRLHPLSRILFGPYLLLSAFSFWLYRVGSREPAYVEVLPGLFFGRRLTAAEVRQERPPAWRGVLDLACEFAEVPGLRSVEDYYSLPVLDATAPSLAQLRRAVRWLVDRLPLGPVYVHCALGHGRSGTIILAYLLFSGETADVREGLKRLRALRPEVKLHRQQAHVLRAFVSAHEPGHGGSR
jgi:hypothetical protein